MSLQELLGVNLLVRCVSMRVVRGVGVVSCEFECEKMCRCAGAECAGDSAQSAVRCFAIPTYEPDFWVLCCRRTLNFSVESLLGLYGISLVVGSEN